MDVERAAEELTERKVVRRGLLTGIAALGAAAVMHVKGASKAEAAPDFVINDTTNAAVSETRLASAGGFAGSVLQVLNGGAANTTFRTAVYGRTSGPDQSCGVAGVTESSGLSAMGVIGTALAGSGGLGVVGQTNSLVGVQGEALTSPGVGIRAVHWLNGTALKAVSNSTGVAPDGNGNGIAIIGKSTGGFGVQGLSTNTHGVRGESENGSGVSGFSVNQPGVDGTSTNSLGIRGTSTNFVGIVGISTNNHGLYGSSNGGASKYGIVAENIGANGPGLLVTGAAPSQVFGGLQVFGGPKNAVIKMQDGTFGSLYSQESPEAYFEDFGRAQLAGGVANVAIEREFATLVGGGDYMVFLTPEGQSAGLYVSSRGPASFQVREANNGMTSISFTYRIVTKRKDIQGQRFARVDTSAVEKVASIRSAFSAMSPAGSTPVPAPAPNNPIVPNPPTVPGVPNQTLTPPQVTPPQSAPPQTPPANGNGSTSRGG